jgi:translation elongation factor EF-G
MLGPALISIVITPLTVADQRRLDTGLRTLMAGDPTITVIANRTSNGVVVAGTSESHLEVILDRVE